MPARLRSPLSLWLIAAGVAWHATAPAVASLPAAASVARAAARIDRVADECPPEPLAHEQVDFHGQVVAWLIARTPLTPHEERELADAAHRELIERVPVVPTPDYAAATLERLVAELPPHLRPPESQYTLTVLDRPQAETFALGGGHVYITAPLLSTLREGGPRGAAALAFFLAHEIGHTALGQARRGHQLQRLQQSARDLTEAKVNRRLLERALVTSINPAGVLARFLYSREQEFAADEFALQLCRNAGVPEDQALDALRLLCLAAHPELAGAAELPADVPRDRSTLEYYFTAHPEPLRRLQRLRRELSGRPEHAAGFGLFAFDGTDESFAPAPDSSVAAGQRAVVFLHGMEGGSGTYLVLMRALFRDPGTAHLRLLELRYPNDQSLACSGEFLVSEMRRVCADARSVDFVCHSAGGLVFRHYAEARRGEFRQAIFQGTPHAGSDLVRLRSLLELAQFVQGLKLGYPEALRGTLLDGHGQILHDLHPDSLFLRHLARASRCAEAPAAPSEQGREACGPPLDRYHIIRGRRMRSAQAAALQGALAVARESLLPAVRRDVPAPLLRRAAVDGIERLTLPEEIRDGDLVVSTASAALPGVADVLTLRTDHQGLKTDADAIRRVRDVLLAD